MLRRIIIICAGIVCGAGASQAPEFTQQYLQRLGGWVDSYNDRVARLDERAAQFKMTREDYLAALQASDDPKVRKEADNIATWPVYQKRFAEMQARLKGATPWMRPVILARSYGDQAFGPIIQATWADYVPATPVTPEGAAYGGIGFVAGWAMVGLLGVPVRMIRRRRGPQRPKLKIDRV